jgi:hypothetical protein
MQATLKVTIQVSRPILDFLKAYCKFNREPIELFLARELHATVQNVVDQPDNWFSGKRLGKVYGLEKVLDLSNAFGE